MERRANLKEEVSFMTENGQNKIESPCNNVCKINWKGFCVGCLRNMREISGWATMTDTQRERILAEIPKRREAFRASFL